MEQRRYIKKKEDSKDIILTLWIDRTSAPAGFGRGNS